MILYYSILGNQIVFNIIDVYLKRECFIKSAPVIQVGTFHIHFKEPMKLKFWKKLRKFYLQGLFHEVFRVGGGEGVTVLVGGLSRPDFHLGSVDFSWLALVGNVEEAHR